MHMNNDTRYDRLDLILADVYTEEDGRLVGGGGIKLLMELL